MSYQIIKIIHIISATFLFGAGTGTALMVLRAFFQYKKKVVSVESLDFALDHAIFVDWIFTLGAGIVQLISGVALGIMGGYSFIEGWLLSALILFGAVILLWIPAAFLQIRMKKELKSDPDELSIRFRRLMRIWMSLGAPAFMLMIYIFYLMVFKGNR